MEEREKSQHFRLVFDGRLWTKLKIGRKLD